MKIFICLIVLPFLVSLATGREAFRVHLGPYFTERQNGNFVQVDIEFTYEGVLERALMPDYREIQILVENLIYGETDINIYWELVNRELVRRILVAYPQFPDVASSFTVFPRNHLVITRSSEVHWAQEDLDKLGRESNFDRQAFYQLRGDRTNILVPRVFRESIAPHLERMNSDPASPFFWDISIHQLEGNEALLQDALNTAGPTGPYAFVVLPTAAAPEGWVRGPSVGNLKGWVEVSHPESTNDSLLLEWGLAYFLGMAAEAEFGFLAEVREEFFLGSFGRTAFPRAYTAAYQALGWPMKPFGEAISLYLFFHQDKHPGGELLEALAAALAE